MVSPHVPTKRELKGLCYQIVQLSNDSFTTCPYKEGTESLPGGGGPLQGGAVSPHVPTKRELKETQTSDTSTPYSVSPHVPTKRELKAINVLGVPPDP